MGKGLSSLVIVAGLLISPQPIQSQDFPSAGREVYQSLLRTAFSFARVLEPSKITFFADGGGDGGGSGDGGSGTGTGTGDAGTGDGTGDSASNGAADAAAAAATSDDAAAAAATADDAAAAAAAASSDDAAAAAATTTNAVAATTTTTDNAPDAPSNTDPSAVAPPSTDPTTDPATVTPPAITAVTTPTTDPTTIALTPELAAIESIPTTDPRGGFGPVTPTDTGTLGPGGTIAPGAPAAPVDVYINAVIVSSAQSPWDAIKRAPGVRNVIVTGGVIALGKMPIAGEIPGGGPQPAWLRLIPDLDLCSGKKIPPVVPNVIDIRIMNCPIKIENLPE